MTEHNKISSDMEATVGSEQVATPSQRRRRLVKGIIIASPAIMTVRRGYANGPIGSMTQAEAQTAVCNSESFIAWNNQGRQGDPPLAWSSFYNLYSADPCPPSTNSNSPSTQGN